MTEVERAIVELRMESIASRAFLVGLFQEVVRSEAVPRERIRELLRRIPRELAPGSPAENLRGSGADHYGETIDQIGAQILAAVDRVRQR